MTTTSSAKIEAAATIFATLKSSSSKAVKNTDGNLEQCKKSSTKDNAPPEQCGASLRLELVPLAKKAPPESANEGGPIESGCPKGLALADDACRRPVAGKTHLCDPSDYPDCKKQCDAGHAESCVNLAFMYDGGVVGPKGEEIVVENESEARDTLIRACDLGSAEGCGYVMSQFRAAPTSPEKALELVKAACGSANATACYYLGGILVEGLAGIAPDPAAGYTAYRRACDGGSVMSCTEAAGAFASGKGVTKDLLAAATMWIRSCEGGRVDSCVQAAHAFERGEGVAKDPKRATDMYRLACDHGTRYDQKVDEACAAAKQGGAKNKK